MSSRRNTSKLLPVLFLLSLVSTLLSVETVTDMKEIFNETKKSGDEKKKKAPAKSTGYRTSETIEKAPTEDHPCTLIRTSERISFPALRNELFVNFLGYREPNLIHVMRCKGVCGDADTPIACRAVKIQERKVMMMFKTNSSGRDSKHRIKELILDEHIECGCKCLNFAHCAGRFNEVTCDCECDESSFGEEKRACESRTSTYWDKSMCLCKSKSVGPRGLDYNNIDCNRDIEGQDYIEYSIERGFDMFKYVIIGAGITLSILLSATTCYYKRKWQHLKMIEKTKTERKYKKPKKSTHKHPINKYKHQDTNAVKTNNMSSKSASKQAMKDLEQLLSSVVLSPSGGELYHEQYNEHGVRIEKMESDDELINRYIHNV